MDINIRRTEESVIIKLPSTSLPEDIEVALNYLRYLQIGAKSSITQADVADFVRETKDFENID